MSGNTLTKDPNSQAVLETDTAALANYKKRRNVVNTLVQSHRQLKDVEERMVSMEKKIEHLFVEVEILKTKTCGVTN